MKTKKISLTLVCLLFGIAGATAQTYYYNTTKTFNENGYTYQCDKNEDGSVDLYNKSNIYTYAAWTYKDGSPLSNDIAMGYVKLIEDDTWTKAKCYSIVNNAFNAYFTSIVTASLPRLSFFASFAQESARKQLIQQRVQQEKQRLQGNKVDVSMTVDTSTGKVIEVDFWFTAQKGFGTIPVSVYRKIETDLKSQIWFTMTPAGKQLKFVKNGWMHKVE